MTTRRSFGERHGVRLHIAAWDGVAAAVDLSCACMFTREANGDAPQGGLAHLDAVFGQRLTGWRRDGGFRAERGESLFISHPPADVSAAALLIVGLGNIDGWSPSVIAGAVSTAYAAASLRRLASVAFAPSILDAGLTADRIGDAGDRMVHAVASAIDLDARLHREGFGDEGSVRDWVFDVGAARFDDALARFRAALEAVGSTGS